MARGRKRKIGRRHPSGKLVQPGHGESQRDAMATVLEARQRHFGISVRQARDERLGTALGRMAFAEKITADQFAAAELYGELIARCNAVMGLPSEQPRSVTGLLINEGIFGGGAPEPDPELVEKIRRQAAGAALMLRTCDQDMQGSAGRRPSVLVHLLACHDVEALRWSAVDLHNLRLGLETLCRFFRIRRDC
jgi:hypothetical protein